MKKNLYEFPKSSFLSLAKDTSLIINKILSNKAVLKLIYYTSSDALSKDDLTSEQIKSLFTNKQVSNIPKIVVDENKYTYIRVTFDDFTTNATNNYFRDHIVEIKIASHFDDWNLDNFELRPYRIAGEIDSMLDGSHLSGIGELTFLTASQDVYDDEYGGITLRYLAVNGDDDRTHPLE